MVRETYTSNGRGRQKVVAGAGFEPAALNFVQRASTAPPRKYSNLTAKGVTMSAENDGFEIYEEAVYVLHSEWDAQDVASFSRREDAEQYREILIKKREEQLAKEIAHL